MVKSQLGLINTNREFLKELFNNLYSNMGNPCNSFNNLCNNKHSLSNNPTNPCIGKVNHCSNKVNPCISKPNLYINKAKPCIHKANPCRSANNFITRFNRCNNLYNPYVALTIYPPYGYQWPMAGQYQPYPGKNPPYV